MGAVLVMTEYGDPTIGTPERRYAMGDKGKKDKDKARKQKIVKQEQSAKMAQEKVAIKIPLQKVQ